MTPNIAPLRNVAKLTELVHRVHDRAPGLPGMAVFHGPSGWGKTSATAFVENEFQAHCVQVLSCWTPSYFLQSIMGEIGLKPVKGVPAMVAAIAGQLNMTGRPLIIDDAQYLTKNKKLIELARDLHEASQATIILVGEEELPQHLTKWENIHNRQLTHAAALPCNMSDAHRLVEIYSPDIEIAEDLLDDIVEASGGSIRRVVTNIAEAQEAALERGARFADRSIWGNRAFVTGHAPAVRKLGAMPKPPTQLAAVKAGGRS